MAISHFCNYWGYIQTKEEWVVFVKCKVSGMCGIEEISTPSLSFLHNLILLQGSDNASLGHKATFPGPQGQVRLFLKLQPPGLEGKPGIRSLSL